jgi:hypothetical protein
MKDSQHILGISIILRFVVIDALVDMRTRVTIVAIGRPTSNFYMSFLTSGKGDILIGG